MNIVLVFFTLVLVGCMKPALYSKKVERVTYAKHSEHGLVKTTNELYSSKLEECQRSYNVIINVDGKETTGSKDLLMAWAMYKIKTESKIRKMGGSGSAAHAGTMAALSVTTGSQYSTSSNNSMSKEEIERHFNNMKHPDYYYKIERINKKSKECMNDSGWSLYKTEFYEKSNGKLIETTFFKE